MVVLEANGQIGTNSIRLRLLQQYTGKHYADTSVIGREVIWGGQTMANAPL